jgi:hypothetical protein
MTSKELQETFDEITAQLKRLDSCFPPDKNSEHYKALWDSRVEIKMRLIKLIKAENPCECDSSMTPMMTDINSTPSETYYWWVCNKCNAETKHIREDNKPNPKFYDK